jgi:hypothetical protein
MRSPFARVVPLSLLALVGLAACSKPATEQPVGPAPESGNWNTFLEVSNRSSSDMDIFLLRRGQRARLGLAPGGETTRFEVHPVQVAGSGTVVFEARPVIGSGGRPARSDPTVLLPGDVIKLDIPPN